MNNFPMDLSSQSSMMELLGSKNGLAGMGGMGMAGGGNRQSLQLSLPLMGDSNNQSATAQNFDDTDIFFSVQAAQTTERTLSWMKITQLAEYVHEFCGGLTFEDVYKEPLQELYKAVVALLREVSDLKQTSPARGQSASSSGLSVDLPMFLPSQTTRGAAGSSTSQGAGEDVKPSVNLLHYIQNQPDAAARGVARNQAMGQQVQGQIPAGQNFTGGSRVAHMQQQQSSMSPTFNTQQLPQQQQQQILIQKQQQQQQQQQQESRRLQMSQAQAGQIQRQTQSQSQAKTQGQGQLQSPMIGGQNVSVLPAQSQLIQQLAQQVHSNSQIPSTTTGGQLPGQQALQLVQSMMRGNNSTVSNGGASTNQMRMNAPNSRILSGTPFDSLGLDDLTSFDLQEMELVNSEPLLSLDSLDLDLTGTLGGGQKRTASEALGSTDESGLWQKRKKKKPANRQNLVCHICQETETPEWRKGPDGNHTLCNACGLNYAKKMKQERQNLERQGRRKQSIDVILDKKKYNFSKIIQAERVKKFERRKASKLAQQRARMAAGSHLSPSDHMSSLLSPSPAESLMMSPVLGNSVSLN